MGESSIRAPDTKKLEDKPADVTLFQRKIHFHPARKPFLGFTNNNPNFHLQTLNPTTPKAPSTEITLKTAKPSSGDPFEHGGFDPELCFGITVRRIGAGLENLGNTCFLNSVLQCLTYTEPFAAYLQSGKHKSSCHTTGFCAMCAIQNHVKRALQSTGRILAPKDLVVNLRCISRSFRNARQEDAHEYMVNLLESMHKCCLPSGVPSESPSAYEKSLVHKIFGGRLRSQVKCMQCSYCSDTFDPFLDLSLEINKADSLHKALTHFTAVEQLDGGQRQYQCQRCKQKVKALKQLTVHKAPFVLSIHLKRFGSHIPGQKIDKKVEFGPTLDLKPFVSGHYEGNLKYTLYGVLVHAGWSTHSGHYYCFVRTSSGMWHNLDDNRVVQVNEKTVLQQKAYMLFYVRDRPSLAPRKPIERKENTLPRVIKDTENRVSVQVKSVQNGPVPTGVCTSDLSKKTLLEESSVGKITVGSVVMAENSSQLKDSISQSSSKALVNERAVQSTNVPSMEVHPRSVLPSVGRSNPGSHPIAAASGTKTDLEYLHQGSNSVHVPPSRSGSLNSSPKKLVINNANHMIDIITNKGPSGAEPPKINNIRFEKNISARLSTESDSENNQKEAEVSSEHFRQKADGNRLTSKKTRLAELFSKSIKGSGYVKKEDSGYHSLQKVLKPKKIMKPRMTNMHPGSGFLMKASLSLYKRKKQKKNRQKNLGLKSHIHKNSGGLEPSTSEKTRSTNLVSTHSKKRPRKSPAEKGSSQMRSKDVQTFKEFASSKDIQTIKGESVNPEDNLKERINQKNAVFGSNELPQKSSSPVSEEKQSVPREPDTSRVKRGMIENGLTSSEEKQSVPKEPDTSRVNSGLFENGLMSVLTRGLEEFTVARWDETEPPSQVLGSKVGRSINIGYVPDEWDEEYDRGKRKKVRNPKDDFGGSNPFQEIASQKEKLKKTKVDRFGSGNQPLRIR